MVARQRPETKRTDEGAEAFEAFAIYRDMGVARSTAQVARELGKSKALMDRWSSKYAWVARAHSYDLELDRRKRLGDLAGIEKMRKRQIQVATAMIDLGYVELEKRMKRATKKSKADTLDAREIVKLIDVGAKLERLNRGEPGEIVQTNAGEGLDLSTLTLDEIKQLRALRSKARARQMAEEEGKGESK